MACENGKDKKPFKYKEGEQPKGDEFTPYLEKDMTRTNESDFLRNEKETETWAERAFNKGSLLGSSRVRSLERFLVEAKTPTQYQTLKDALLEANAKGALRRVANKVRRDQRAFLKPLTGDVELTYAANNHRALENIDRLKESVDAGEIKMEKVPGWEKWSKEHPNLSTKEFFLANRRAFDGIEEKYKDNPKWIEYHQGRQSMMQKYKNDTINAMKTAGIKLDSALLNDSHGNADSTAHLLWRSFALNVGNNAVLNRYKKMYGDIDFADMSKSQIQMDTFTMIVMKDAQTNLRLLGEVSKEDKLIHDEDLRKEMYDKTKDKTKNTEAFFNSEDVKDHHQLFMDQLDLISGGKYKEFMSTMREQGGSDYRHRMDSAHARYMADFMTDMLKTGWYDAHAHALETEIPDLAEFINDVRIGKNTTTEDAVRLLPALEDAVDRFKHTSDAFLPAVELKRTKRELNKADNLARMKDPVSIINQFIEKHPNHILTDKWGNKILDENGKMYKSAEMKLGTTVLPWMEPAELMSGVATQAAMETSGEDVPLELAGMLADNEIRLIPKDVSRMVDVFSKDHMEADRKNWLYKVAAFFRRNALLAPTRIIPYTVTGTAFNIYATVTTNPGAFLRWGSSFHTIRNHMEMSKQGPISIEKMTPKQLEEHKLTEAFFSVFGDDGVKELMDLDTKFWSEEETFAKSLEGKSAIGKAQATWGRMIKTGGKFLKFREAWHRHAMAAEYYHKLKTGPKDANGEPIVQNYGAANRARVDAEKDLFRKAAILANESMIDYSRTSTLTRKLNAYMIPFVTFTEGMLKWQYRLYKNMLVEGIIRGQNGGRARNVARMVPVMAIQAGVLGGLWNKLMEAFGVFHPEEDNTKDRTLMNKLGDHLLGWTGLDFGQNVYIPGLGLPAWMDKLLGIGHQTAKGDPLKQIQALIPGIDYNKDGQTDFIHDWFIPNIGSRVNPVFQAISAVTLEAKVGPHGEVFAKDPRQSELSWMASIGLDFVGAGSTYNNFVKNDVVEHATSKYSRNSYITSRTSAFKEISSLKNSLGLYGTSTHGSSIEIGGDKDIPKYERQIQSAVAAGDKRYYIQVMAGLARHYKELGFDDKEIAYKVKSLIRKQKLNYKLGRHDSEERLTLLQHLSHNTLQNLHSIELFENWFFDPKTGYDLNELKA